MGAISFSIDKDLVRELHRHSPFELFIETGTFRGDGLAAARSLFQKCISIELSPEYYAAARDRFAGDLGIELLSGDSARLLREQRPKFETQPTLFWLDAHWCAALNTAGEKSQCPLLAELEAIGTLHANSALLIDDARLFLAPPPHPHEISNWPALADILPLLHRLSDRHVLVCYNDVLVYLPAKIAPAMRDFFQAHTVDWLTLAHKAREYDPILAEARAKDVEIESLHKAYTVAQAALTAKDVEIELLHKAYTVAQAALTASHHEADTMRETAEERLRVMAKIQSALEAERAEAHALRTRSAELERLLQSRPQSPEKLP